MSVKKRENNIISSAEDKRKYRALILKNNMQVMLISDPATDKSAAALDVHIGSMSDPWELPGLAHFCEHMLFMGTEKYPSENDYNKYLSENGGGSNAYTAADHTNYYFDVAPEDFKGAIDRFAQFFITPLFTESAVDREVNAVNSEHEKNLQNDYWRLSQVEKSTSNPDHDYSKFGTGNKDTLDIIPKQNGISVRNCLLDFHKKYYSANIMALAILGKENLNELEEIAISLFSDVENHDVEIPYWSEHPFSEKELKKKAFIVPVKDIRNLNITFPIPDLRPYYKTSPGHYLGHLIGHEGPGSLLSFLKAQGWVNSIVAGQKSGGNGFAFFVVNVDLTEEGIKHVDDIVQSIFQYIEFLREKGPQKWVFEECRDINAMTFRFKDKEVPQSYVSSVAEALHYYPLSEVLSGEYLLSEYDPKIITSVLDCLTVDKVRVAVIGKHTAFKVDVKEKWYGTDFKIEDIDDETLKLWDGCCLNEELKLPPRNEFVPTNFDLYRTEEPVPENPVLLSETPLSRVWYKLDTEFNLPKTSMYIEFFSRMAYLDPNHTNLLHMFVQLFRDSLTEYAYAAELAGLHYNLQNTKYGLQLNIKGYSDKQDVLLKKIIEKLTTFKVDPKRFEILKDAYVRALRNFAADQPHQHLIYYTSLLLSEIGWSKEELLNAVEDLTVENLETFIPRFLSNLHLEFLIHGNASKEQAEKIAEIVISHISQHSHTKPLLPSQLVRQREYQLPLGCSFVYEAENTIHKSSAVETFYQFGQMNTHENMLGELLVQIFKEPAFDELRTKEQLGYIVWCGLRRSNGIQGLRLIIQGDKSPRYLDSRIECFLLKMKDVLLEMSEEEFLKHRVALAKRRLERPKKLSHLTVQWWLEVTSNQFHFDRDHVEVDHLTSVTKEDLIEFYNRFVYYESPERKKLSVQVLSTASGGAGDTSHLANDDTTPQDGLKSPPHLQNVRKISEIPDFKTSLPLYPLMKPYICVTIDSKSKL
ncbi:Insulin-degrading enzyme [Armadillidium vulgare]|nr:Insulin-degrading enzyme [Armadillidium vulgare]